MKIEEFVAVSGLSGLYKMVANRNNGLIVADLDTGKRKFAPARKHQFTPLASIGIYTNQNNSRSAGDHAVPGYHRKSRGTGGADANRCLDGRDRPMPFQQEGDQLVDGAAGPGRGPR